MGSDLIYIPIYSNNGIVKAVLYDLFSQAEPKNTFVLLFQKQLLYLLTLVQPIAARCLNLL